MSYFTVVGTFVAESLICHGRRASGVAEQQTGIYGPDGKSIGTVVPQNGGFGRSNSLGMSTTTDNTTKFYDAGGRPAGSFQFDGRMRRQ